MLDRVINFIAEFGGLFKPFEVIDAYQQGVVLRWGKYHRTLEPGFTTSQATRRRAPAR